MKKFFTAFSVLILLSFSSPLPGQKKDEEKKPDPTENLSLVETLQSVPEKMKQGFESITGKEASSHLAFLSADSLEGRDTASHGYDIAAHYVATMFALWGIQPAGDMIRPIEQSPFRMQRPPSKKERGYLQEIDLREILESKGSACVDWQKNLQKKSHLFYSDIDYLYSGTKNQSITAPVVFVGYGIKEESLTFNEYKNIDVKGKIVLMLTEAPGKDDPESPFNKGELKEKYYPVHRMRHRTSPKVTLAKTLGAEVILLVENSPKEKGDVARRALDDQKINDERPILPGSRRRITLIQGKAAPMPWDTIPTVRISREMADIILGFAEQDIETLKHKIEKSLKPHSTPLLGVTFTLTTTVKTRLVRSQNVLGYIQGSDPKLKDEVVIIGAHLDHLGKRGDYIFNGADDNGSGSVGVMEIAEAFVKNPSKPKRSVLFALWTGEEKGLLGSRYYIANPFFPLNKTMACLNLDMISREWSTDRLKRMSRMFGVNVDNDILGKIDIKNFIVLSLDGKMAELANLVRQNNQHVGLSLYLNKSEGPSGGSDHAGFAMRQIPWVFFFAGMTEDYHQPSDTVEKISAPLMEKIMRLAYLTSYTLADTEPKTP